MAKIELVREDTIATIRLNRPEKRNALTLEMLYSLGTICDQIEHDETTSVVILTGCGEKSFCAGGDIYDWSGHDSKDFALRWISEGNRIFDRLACLHQPVIAALNGDVLGGGLELAATADFRIAEEHIRFAQPESSLGVIPGWSGTHRVVRRFGAQAVRQMALLGNSLDAHTARDMSVADTVVATGQSLNQARAWAQQLLTKGTLATCIIKKLINAAEGEQTQDRVLDITAGGMIAASPELQQRLQSFFNRKKDRT